MGQRRSYLVNTIIFINVAVFLMWHGIGSVSEQFMENHFLVSWSALEDGRYFTLLGSVFSHIWVWHILINMFVLKSFGSFLEIILGRRQFLAFYLIAGIFSSFCHAAVSAFVLHQPSLPALGASGAISGLVVVFALMFPKQKILLLGFIPLPALWGAAGFIAWDLWGLSQQAHGGGLPIGHGAHLGGALAGILYYFLIVKPKKRRALVRPMQ